MDEHAAAYRGIRERIIELTGAVEPEVADQLAPATPAWRVRDVVAHVTGVNADVLGGNIEGAGTDPWTAVQVESRRDRTLAEILDEWNRIGPGLDEIMPAIPDSPRSQIIFDTLSHEHDVRGALGVPGATDDHAAAIGFAWAAGHVGTARDRAGAGALRLRTEHGDLVAGTGDVTATVAADRFELLRAMTGRRSAAQVASFAWDGPVAVDHLCLFPPRATDLVE
jgi:uncharacterized protein (TIGR03083 family)